MLKTANGTPVGPIGQGTWYLGEHPDRDVAECEALRRGFAAGMNLIDTAEMYGNGASERMIGRAIAPLDRASLYIVSKVYPHNAGRRNIFTSCKNSLRRLNTDYLDLYLLHWRGSVPLAETAACMEELKAEGLIRAWGVSNLDADDMQELSRVKGGGNCQVDQVLYHLGSRGVEYDLLPWLRDHKMQLMAYCPLAQNGSLRRGLLASKAVQAVAQAHEATAQQILLAFLLSKPGVLPIPRTGHAVHAVENAAAAKITLTPEELAALDKAFPPPTHRVPLDMQ